MAFENRYYVYLLTNWNNRVLYVGVTNDLVRRLKLVYFEETQDIMNALAGEKEIKKWRREKKDALIVSMNPEWKDLSELEKDFSLRSK